MCWSVLEVGEGEAGKPWSSGGPACMLDRQRDLDRSAVTLEVGGGGTQHE